MGQNIILKIAPLSLTLVMVMRFTHTTALGPNIDDLVKVQCPSDKPYLCLPYGSCCRGFEFCHHGNCESCFPQAIQESELLSWCKGKGPNNVSLIRHSSCGMACQFRFSASSLDPCEDPIDACGCPPERPKKCSFGQCCRYDQYCNGQHCTSCFPENVTEPELDDLCRNSSYLSSRDSCKFACLNSSLSSQHSETQELNPWMFASIGLAILSTLLIAISLYLYRNQHGKVARRRKTQKQQKAAEIPLLNHVNNNEIQDPPITSGIQRSLSKEENPQLRATGSLGAADEIHEADEDTVSVHS